MGLIGRAGGNTPSSLQPRTGGETSNNRPIYFTNPNIFPNTRSISLHV